MLLAGVDGGGWREMRVRAEASGNGPECSAYTPEAGHSVKKTSVTAEADWRSVAKRFKEMP